MLVGMEDSLSVGIGVVSDISRLSVEGGVAGVAMTGGGVEKVVGSGLFFPNTANAKIGIAKMGRRDPELKEEVSVAATVVAVEVPAFIMVFAL